jgi:hypothetical protein
LPGAAGRQSVYSHDIRHFMSSQASDVGSIPIARSPMIQLTLPG